MRRIGICSVLGLIGAVAWGAPTDDARRLPGRVDAATVLLPNQWSLRPAGRMTELGDFPASMALDPSGRWLAILHSGDGTNEAMIVGVDRRRPRVECRVPVDSTFIGVAWADHGERLFASGAEDNVVHAWRHAGGLLSDHMTVRAAPPSEEGYVSGVAVIPTGNEEPERLAVALMRANRVVALTPAEDGGSPEMTTVAQWLSEEAFPHSIVVAPDGSSAWVSLWGGGCVERIDLRRHSTARLRVMTGNHPNEMILSRDGARLFVACANDNTVHVIETASGRTLEVLNTALHPNSPEGSTPNSVDLSPDEGTLFVANADNNDVAVFNVAEPGHASGVGFIPTGWYPTSVCVSADGARLFVANGKGDQSFANSEGPNPFRYALTTEQYIGQLMRGTLSTIPLPEEDDDYDEMTQHAYDCSPYRADLTPVAEPDGPNPIPREVGGESPITHVLYIIKENRTYDQVLGDMIEGNGDADICLFPERVTPNQHALARRYVLFDNFYVESEVSADGHEWTTGAYATDFVERIWPLNYSGRWSGYPAEGTYDTADADAGHIWDRCAEAGVSYRSYGEFIDNGEETGDPGTASVPSLEGHFDPMYRGYDLSVTDVSRAERFLSELASFEAAGELPRFIVLRLPNDHTSGTSAGKPTPTAYVADNDLGLGMILEGLSRSPFWPHMAVFIVEDDAQNGSDHVDAHRTTAFIASPYAKRGHVDSHMYSTASMLRTMELILGLEPMSQFDAGARPMYDAFTMDADPSPIECLPAQVDLHETNTRRAPMAAISATLNLAREDAADDILFNRIIWAGVRGTDTMPPPRRAAFLRAEHEDEEEEERGRDGG